MAVQADGRLLVGGAFHLFGGTDRPGLVRLLSDGTFDSSFGARVGGTQWAVNAFEVEPDGSILAGGTFETINSVPRPGLARLRPDGTLVVETTMETPLGALAGLHWVGAGGTRTDAFRLRDRITSNLMLQHDGRLVAGGTAPSAATPLPPAPVRLRNTPAVHVLEVLGGGRVRWTRGGSAPETQQTTVEVSEDGGRTYGTAVPGLRVQGGWEFAGLVNVSDHRLRLRARVSGGRGNGSSSLAEWITVAGANRPTPEVYQPAGTLVNPAEGRRFPDTDVGGFANLTFTLLNTGTADLRLDAVVVDGPGAPAFVLTTPIPSVLPGPYGSATFGVSFRPKSAGDFAATLEFFSPDPLLGRFTLRLDGRGRNPAPSSNAELADLRLGSGVLIQERFSGPPLGLQLRRLKPDGSEDPGFLPFQVAGGFSNPLAVISLPDGGVTFSDLGLASRVENGWELAGLALPGTGHIRAHARYVAGPENRDSSLAESIMAYSLVSGPREAWRQRHFGTDANVGPAADGEDPDGDGLTNFAEFAGGSDPNEPNEPPLQPLAGTTGSELRVAFVRSREAMESGVVWVVEWSDTLSDAVAWSSTGVNYSVMSESAHSQQVLARVPAGPAGATVCPVAHPPPLTLGPPPHDSRPLHPRQHPENQGTSGKPTSMEPLPIPPTDRLMSGCPRFPAMAGAHGR
ncbi:MAG: choice-of-anchor D domain-containing protein [Verrucomicrobiales bacterium]